MSLPQDCTFQNKSLWLGKNTPCLCKLYLWHLQCLRLGFRMKTASCRSFKLLSEVMKHGRWGCPACLAMMAQSSSSFRWPFDRKSIWGKKSAQCCQFRWTSSDGNSNVDIFLAIFFLRSTFTHAIRANYSLSLEQRKNCAGSAPQSQPVANKDW